jgi:hypothetical protein
MSIFEYRSRQANHSTRDSLGTLRETVERLEAEPDETPQIADFKRILAGRIEQIKRRTR